SGRRETLPPCLLSSTLDLLSSIPHPQMIPRSPREDSDVASLQAPADARTRRGHPDPAGGRGGLPVGGHPEIPLPRRPRRGPLREDRAALAGGARPVRR